MPIRKWYAGSTTEISGNILGLVELSHWYENIFLLGVVALFLLDCELVERTGRNRSLLRSVLFRNFDRQCVPAREVAEHAEIGMAGDARGRRNEFYGFGACKVV